MSDTGVTPVTRTPSRPGSDEPIHELVRLVSTIERMPITAGPDGEPPLETTQVDLRLLWFRFSDMFRAKNHQAALELANIALTNAPNSRRWRLGMMLALIGAKRCEQALAIGQALFETWPDRLEIHRAMALACLGAGKINEARSWAELAEGSASSPEQARIAKALLARVNSGRGASHPRGQAPAPAPKPPPAPVDQRKIPTGVIELHRPRRGMRLWRRPAPRTAHTQRFPIEARLDQARRRRSRARRLGVALALALLAAGAALWLLAADGRLGRGTSGNDAPVQLDPIEIHLPLGAITK